MTSRETLPQELQNHGYDWDPAYGRDREALLHIPAPEEPADFNDFWENRYRQAQQVDISPELSAPQVERGREVYDVTFTTLDGKRSGGWLVRTPGVPVERGAVCTHGYGGRDAPELSYPFPDTTAVFFPCLIGQSRSRREGVSDDAFSHVLHGIESRETYIHGYAAADIWCAASALLTLFPEAGACLDYSGGSYGGGIGALALPWDHRFRRVYLGVPSFGNHPLRLTLPCSGSGESVRQYAATHPEVRETLKYFDAALAARHLHKPTLVGAALFDPAVPPPGQFAVYNALPGPKELFPLTAGHFSWSGEARENQELFKRQQAFFA